MNLYTSVSERGTMEGGVGEVSPLAHCSRCSAGGACLRRNGGSRGTFWTKLDSAFLSSVALARRAGVSQPSVTRFAAALGFSGYPALREALRMIALGPAGPSGVARGAGVLPAAA